MANKQIIFVVETNDKGQTDDIYIKKLINSYYDLTDNDITYKFVHMSGIGNYKNKSVTAKINNYKKENLKGQNIIMYCFDTDRIDKDFESVAFLEEVKNYCKVNNYEFVWFCYEIENVFLSKTVLDVDKLKEAIKYAKREIIFGNRIIRNMSVTDAEQKTNNKSNIVLVLNKYFKKNKNN